MIDLRRSRDSLPFRSQLEWDQGITERQVEDIGHRRGAPLISKLSESTTAPALDTRLYGEGEPFLASVSNGA